VCPRVGFVIELETVHPRYAVRDVSGAAVEPVVLYLREVALDDNRPLRTSSRPSRRPPRCLARACRCGRIVRNPAGQGSLG
jgi:hypothetical protein